MKLEEYGIDFNHGIHNIGNLYNHKVVFEKAKRGEKVTLGFLGGSITQGCLSTTPENCYAYLVYKWWKNMYNNTEIVYKNAGIGGTTSQFGVARVEEDILEEDVDFLIVEFSVNDENTMHFKETYEGLIRRIMTARKDMAILLVHSVRYDTGENAQDIHISIAKHYELPSISMKETIYEAMKKGYFSNKDITEDDLHPNDLGHEMMAKIICNMLERILKEQQNEKSFIQLPQAITKNEYENAKRYTNENIDQILIENHNFGKDCSAKIDYLDIFKNGFLAYKKDDCIRVEVEASSIGVQYKKTIQKPAPIAMAYIDGDYENGITLDANFEEDWGDSLHLETIAEHISFGKHIVEIRIIDVPENIKSPFYLVSIIASGK